jgi:hypothetical protein
MWHFGIKTVYSHEKVKIVQFFSFMLLGLLEELPLFNSAVNLEW